VLRFGVNYTPRRRWFHAWLDFDPDEVREDLTQVAELGLDHRSRPRPARRVDRRAARHHQADAGR
jgi:hypothetical protein